MCAGGRRLLCGMKSHQEKCFGAGTTDTCISTAMGKFSTVVANFPGFERQFNLQNRNVHRGIYRMRKKIVIEVPLTPSKEVCVIEVETKARGWKMETLVHVLNRDPDLNLPLCA